VFKKFAPVFDKNLSFEEKIRFFFREHITFLQENPKLPAFILNEINRNPERVKKVIKKIDFQKTWQDLYDQHKEELEALNITRDKMPQLLISLASLSVFPFAAKGIIEIVLEKSGIDFKEFIEERKEFTADFVIKSIRNQNIR
jgi:TetR/AcrR family transcriptional regulator